MAATDIAPGTRLIFRHRATTRIWHWVNVVTVTVMLMSGLMIFNAHPRLYWGKYGANPDPAWLEIGSREDAGYLRIGGSTFNTDGALGRWEDAEGEMQNRAFPAWSTIPSNYSLSTARRWHLTFAWLFALGGAGYALSSLISGHAWHDLTPRRSELRARNILRTCKDHAMLRFADCREKYNILQKMTYFSVVFILLPSMIFSGLAMSPAATATAPWLLDMFGGRQSARSIHFIVAALLVLFVIVHVIMILISGPLNGLRSMITGYSRETTEVEQ